MVFFNGIVCLVCLIFPVIIYAYVKKVAFADD